MCLDKHKLVMAFLVVLLGGRTVTALLNPSGVVYVIDDDVQVRGGLANLFKSVGLQVEAFATTTEFLASLHNDVPQCLVLAWTT